MPREKINVTTEAQHVAIEGIVTASILEPKTSRDFDLIEKLRQGKHNLEILAGKCDEKARNMRRAIYRKNRILEEMLIESCMIRQITQKNIVTTAGLAQVTKGLSDNLSTLDDLSVNYTAVGDGNTAPVAGNTTLGNETFRNTVNSLNYADNIFFASMTIDFAEDTGTYKEAGLFINGTASADSGTLFNHVLLSAPDGITKTSAQVLAISFQITFSPV